MLLSAPSDHGARHSNMPAKRKRWLQKHTRLQKHLCMVCAAHVDVHGQGLDQDRVYTA